MKKYIKFIPYVIIVCVLFLSFGYATFTSKMSIAGIIASVRPEKNIRVTEFYAISNENNGQSQWEEYSVNRIAADVLMPDAGSTVSYKVQITNLGGISMAVTDITGLPDNMEIVYTDYKLGETLCDSTKNEEPCKHGVQDEFIITIKYKDGGFDSNETFYQIRLNLVFECIYTINYYQLLPDEYQEVEYIESTGTQKIKTDYYPKTNTKLELELSFNGTFKDSNTYNVGNVIFGSQDSNYNEFTINFGANSSQGNLLFLWIDKTYDYGAKIQIFSINDTIRMNRNPLVVDSKNNKITYGTITNDIVNKTADQNSVLYLFGSSSQYFGNYNMRVYKMTISEDNAIKGIYIPCYRKSDNVSGLYDMVSKKFFTNVGSGSFSRGKEIPNGYYEVYSQRFVYDKAQNLIANTYTRNGYTFNGWNTMPDGSGLSYTDEEEVLNLSTSNGDEIKLYAQWKGIPYMVNFHPNTNDSSLPTGYQELEYIESTGTQYIDSGYKPSKNTGVEATFQFTDTTQRQQRLFGVGSDTSVNDLFDYEFYINSRGYWAYAFRDNEGTGGWTETGMVADTKKHTLSFNTKNDQTYFISNTTQVISEKLIIKNATMTNSNYNIYILGRNYYYNVSAGPGSFGKIKLYSFKIYEDGIIQMDFIPCYEISSGKAGLYDKIGEVFYPSARENYELLKDDKSYSQDFVYGSGQNLLANTFVNKGYEFVGWNTEPDGSGTSYTNKELVNNLTTPPNDIVNLYAMWNQNSYTVNFHPNRTDDLYQEVEYVEGTGSQNIDIGYYISGTTGVKAEYEFTDLTVQQRIFGTNYYHLYINAMGNYGYLFSDDNSSWKTNNISVDKGRHIVEFNKELGRLKFDNGNLYNNASLLTGLTSTSARPLFVMGVSDGSYKSKIKIYNFTIYESGETISEFIPCYRISDDMPGLCNVTDNTFRSSSASGMLKGDSLLKSKLFTLNTSQNLEANTYTRFGYIFTGWNTMPDGSGISYTAGQEVLNLSSKAGDVIDLYAQWEEIPTSE